MAHQRLLSQDELSMTRDEVIKCDVEAVAYTVCTIKLWTRPDTQRQSFV